MRSFFIALTRNAISLLGTAITTASAILIITLFLLETFGLEGSPYVGIISYMILPGIFVLGLLLIPLGVWRERRRMRLAEERGEPVPEFPVLDFNRSRTRNWLLIVVALTAINIVILAVATYKGVEVMDSTAFCGATCHSVMNPEYTAYNRSPHARVACVDCHIGPGAGWFAKSKLSGSWQVVSVAFDLYPRPIPTPIHNLRPARETCEQCHWPTKFVGDRLRVKTSYANDEKNTKLETVLLMRVGGREGRVSQGIHWHVDPGIQVRYLSDPSREQIPTVELTQADGTVKRFSNGSDAEAAAQDGGEPEREWRVMDCIDCHNRPTHIYRLPHTEVDNALSEGRLPSDLPYLRREGIRVLDQKYPSHEAARAGITEALTAFYRSEYPQVLAERPDDVAHAAEVLGGLYALDVFPEMNVWWGTYPNHIGHMDFTGCFRCHDGEHETSDGETISQDCDTCHTLLAMEEENPAILSELKP